MPYSNKFINQQVRIFEKEEFGKVRVVMIEGQPWFVAKDICKSLEIKNSRDVLNRLDDDEKGVVLTDTPGGQQNMSAVNEYGLYNLILGSRKPEAKQFKRWITHEVLPEIRKTGFYSIRKPDSYMIEDKYERVKRWEEEQREADAKIEEQRRRALLAEAKVDELSPKAEHFDIAMNSDSLLSMKETAKYHGVSYMEDAQNRVSEKTPIYAGGFIGIVVYKAGEEVDEEVIKHNLKYLEKI